MNHPPIKLVGLAHRERAKALIDIAPDGYVVTIKQATRSLDQNAMLWSLLSDLSDQVVYHGIKLSSEEWKDFATASIRKQKFVPDMDGTGFIALGGRTSKMTKAEFSDLLELIFMIGAKNDVQWSGESRQIINERGLI